MPSIRSGKFTWSCPLTDMKKPDLFRPGFLPLSLFATNLMSRDPYVTRFMT